MQRFATTTSRALRSACARGVPAGRSVRFAAARVPVCRLRSPNTPVWHVCMCVVVGVCLDLVQSVIKPIGAVRMLNVHEYVGMELMHEYGISVPKNATATSSAEAREAAIATFGGTC